ncbi:hypothetical protein B0H13DRAFT_2382644 [Mycena leptocephala]|nr:hypothetical protein B0H13DRAFT_2382644 [Mycena leptocephala]
MENVHRLIFSELWEARWSRHCLDVDRACNVDAVFADPAILSRIVRPSIYIVQQAVNPSFSVLEGHFHLPGTRSPLAFGAAQNTGSHTFDIASEPDYPSHVEIWNASSSVHLLPPDLPVSDRCRGGFQILDHLIRQYSFRGQATSDGRDLEAGLQHLMRVSGCWSVLLAMNLSSTEFVRLPPSQLMDAALASFLPTRVSPSSVESWHPDDSLYGSLVANIRPSVFYIQMFVNPSFDAAPPFVALSFEERISVRRAIRDVLAFLDALLERHFPDTKSLDCRAAVPFVKVPSRSATMFLTLSLFMKEYGFEGDEDKSSPADRFVRAADIFRRASSLAARGAGAKIEPAIGSDRSRSQYEVFFVDFDTQAELVQYLCRPEVVNYCHNVLGPLRDVVSLIHDRFRVRLPLPKDAPWLRRHLANFLHHLGTVARAIGPDESVGRGKRIPTPSYTCLTYMARLIKKFGYDGDNIEHLEEHFSGKPQNPEVARESAISTPELLVIPDIHATPPSSSITHRSFVQGEGSDATSARGDPDSSDAIMSKHVSSPFGFINVGPSQTQGPRTVSQLCGVPTALRLLLPPFLLRLPDLNFYGGEPDGLLRYFVEVVALRPPHQQRLPVTALPVPPTFPIHQGFHVAARRHLLRFLGLAHVIATQIATLTGQGVPIPPETIRTLVLMRKFHIFLGRRL